MLTLVVALKLFLVALIAVLVDRLFGEPRHHPLVWFGNVASWIEQRCNRDDGGTVVSGALSTLCIVLPPVILVAAIQRLFALSLIPSMIFDALVLAFVIGWQSLKEHARAVMQPLEADDLGQARQQLSMIVSRQTARMDATQISGSTVESVLENGHDSLFASLFWYALLGPAGALLHRLVNTLDAMWGYRTARYEQFGKFAARFDDVLGYIPARLTALGYAGAGATRTALDCWIQQSPSHDSPNAGVVMAAGAGAIVRKIGGPAIYHGKRKDKPCLGQGAAATKQDIERSIGLIDRSLCIWLAFFLLLSLFGYFLNL